MYIDIVNVMASLDKEKPLGGASVNAPYTPNKSEVTEQPSGNSLV